MSFLMNKSCYLYIQTNSTYSAGIYIEYVESEIRYSRIDLSRGKSCALKDYLKVLFHC